ncbi:hypothetical protein ES707_12928 [subsurface metagenome]
MAKERLSKLQKWILNKCYERGEKYAYVVRRGQLVREYCQKLKIGRYAESDDQVNISGIQVSITRSIRTLAKKKYIFVHGIKEKPFIDINHVWGKEQRMARVDVATNVKFLRLSDRGVEKLLNVKKWKLNNNKKSLY